MIRTKLESLLVGQPQPFRDDGAKSAIAKQCVMGPMFLGRNGLAGDQVADTAVHGGPDKALHHYPPEHYDFWRTKYSGLELLDRSGAFGENLSATGLTEAALCLGDIFRLGEAIIICTHGRQPCWKLNHHFGEPDVMETIVQTGKCGSYFGVLETGMVEQGNVMILIDRPFPDWPLNRLFNLIIGGGHVGQGPLLRELAVHPVLAKTWRDRAIKLAAAMGA